MGLVAAILTYYGTVALHATLDLRRQSWVLALFLGAFGLSLGLVFLLKSMDLVSALRQIGDFSLNPSANILAMLSCPVLGLLLWSRRPFLALALAILVIATVFSSNSQAAQLFVLVAAAVWAGATISSRVTALFMAACGVILISSMPWLIDSLEEHLRQIPSALWVDNANAVVRLDIWSSYAAIARHVGAFGFGIDSTHVIRRFFDPLNVPPDYLVAFGWKHPHNFGLQTWIELGAVGVVLVNLLWLVAILQISRMLKAVRIPALSLLAGCFAVSMVEYSTFASWRLVTLGVCFATLVAAHRQLQAQQASSDLRPVLFLLTEGYFFQSHFLPLARAARALGRPVAIAARFGSEAESLKAQGFVLMDIPVTRGSTRIGGLLREIRGYRQAIKTFRPSLVHCIALRPIVLGGFAAMLSDVPRMVLAPTGLGFAFASRSASARLVRLGVRLAIAVISDRPLLRFVFENGHDAQALMLRLSLRRSARRVNGAGVSQDAFPATPLPQSPPFQVAVVARMLEIKGIEEAVRAVEICRAKGLDVSLELYGPADPGNPSSISEHQLRLWDSLEGIHWHGKVDDIPRIWKSAHAAMLLSRGGDGLPRSIVEAMASGRAVITTDVPGCRDAVRDGIDGFVVPVESPELAASAITALVEDRALCERMGRSARHRFEETMDEDHIIAGIVDTYRQLGLRSTFDVADGAPGQGGIDR